MGSTIRSSKNRLHLAAMVLVGLALVMPRAFAKGGSGNGDYGAYMDEDRDETGDEDEDGDTGSLVADAGPDHTGILCGSQTVEMLGGAPTAFGGIPPYSYLWSPETGLDDPTAANPQVKPFEDTVYTVTVTDSSAPPLLASDSASVTVSKSLDHCNGQFGSAVGDCAADFTRDDQECNPFTLHDHQCEVIMLVLTNPTWDSYGAAQLKWMEDIDGNGTSLMDAYGDQGFMHATTFSLPRGSQDCTDVGAYYTANNLSGILLDDADNAVFDLYQESNGIPQTIFIARDMTIRYRQIGFTSSPDPNNPLKLQFIQYIEELLAE